MNAPGSGNQSLLGDVLHAARRIGRLYADNSLADPVAVQSEACRLLGTAAEATVTAARSLEPDGRAVYISGWASTPILQDEQPDLRMTPGFSFSEPIVAREMASLPLLQVNREYQSRWRALSPEQPTVMFCPWRSGAETVGYLCLVGEADVQWTQPVVDAVSLASSLIGQYQMRVWAEELHERRLALSNLVQTAARGFLGLAMDTRDEGLESAFAAVGELLDAESVTLWQVPSPNGEAVTPLIEWKQVDGYAPDRHVIQSSEVQRILDQPHGPATAISASSATDVLVAPTVLGKHMTSCLALARSPARPWLDWERQEIALLADTVGALQKKLLAEGRLRATFDEAPTGISLRSDSGELIDCNQAYLDFLGLEDMAQVSSGAFDLVVPARFPDHARTAVRERRLREMSGSEIAYVHADGREVWGQVSLVWVYDEQEPLWITHIEDITARRRAEDLLRLRASTDELTGLANRRGIMDALGTLFDQAEAATSNRSTFCSIVWIDLDGFKIVNDVHGHAAGDQVLIEVGRRLKSRVRRTDQVGRFGGDEYIVILDGPLDGSEAVEQAQRLRLCFGDPFQVGGESVRVGASIGLAIALPDDTPDELLARADAAMYREKIATSQQRQIEMTDFVDVRTNGQPQVGLSRWSQRDADAVGSFAAFHSQLEGALLANEIEFWAQPIIHVPTALPLGIELLARWIRPDGEMVEPDGFVPFAEASGLVLELDRQALVCAERIFYRWRNDHVLSRLGINVNISPNHLMRGLVEDIHSLIPELPPQSLLGIEIVETSLATGGREYLKVLQDLRNRGIRVIVDDFGIGHSSLSRLQEFPASNLKLDKSFIVDIETRPERFEFFASVTKVLTSAGYPVTVEGVETREQLDLVSQTTAAAAQGFHIGHPAPLDEVEEQLRGIIAARSAQH